MFKEMRLKDMQMDESKAIDLLDKCEYGILSTVGENGYCYGTPLNYVYSNGAVYFHCAVEGHKLDNIQHNNKVSFCVVGRTEILRKQFDTKYESVVVFGRTEEVKDEVKINVLLDIVDKYSPEFKEAGKKYISAEGNQTKVIKIVIDKISGKGIY